MSRLSFEISPDQLLQIKALAAEAGLSIKDFILSKALPAPTGETKTTSRLRKAIHAPDSENIVFDSIEDLKHALGF
jgi:hypothetical protein